VIVESQSAEAAQVGDVIYTPHATETSGSHVEMVTAVTRDETGHVVSVRVEESRPPTTANTQRSAASFNTHLAARNKQLLRITDRQAWRGEFAVCDLDLRLPGESISMSQQWQAGFAAENINVIAVYLWNSGDSYGRHPIFLTDEQRKAGSITIPAGLLKKTGALQVWLIGEHPLGRLKLRKDIRLVP